MSLSYVAQKMRHLISGPTPPANSSSLYFKQDGLLYSKGPDGFERQISSDASALHSNPGFEAWSGGAPANWDPFWQDGGVTNTANTSDYVEGLQSLQIDATGQANTFVISSTATVSAGALVTFSFWAKASTSGVTAEALIASKDVLTPSPFLDPDSHVSGTTLAVSTSWTQYTLSAQIPPDHVYVNFTLGSKRASGAYNILFDRTASNFVYVPPPEVIYPVGAIYMSVDPTNPSTYFGGTWTAWGTGRVPVAVDTSQTEFNTVEKTGGAKTHTLSVAEMPSHDHGGATASNSVNAIFAVGTASTNPVSASRIARGSPTDVGSREIDGSTHNHSISSQGGGGAHNNLQPFITCYMWKRVS